MKIKNFVLCIFLIFTLAFVYGCQKKEEVIKIGAILPLTGVGAKYGEEDRNGIELALSESTDPKIEVIYEDDQGTSKGAISSFNKLVSVHKVPVILGLMFSSTALAVAPLGEKREVVIFSTTASSPELTNAGDYFFRNWPSDIYEGSKMAEFSFNELNLRSIAIISVNLDYGVGLTKVFKEVFSSNGGKIISTEYYSQGAVDFRTQLNKLESLEFDAIYLPGYYSEIGLLLRQAKELGIKAKFLSCVGFDNPKVIEIAGEAAEGVIFARPFYNPESNDPIVKNFVKNFKNKFKKDPGIYAAHAYDALKILNLAIKKGGNSPKDIIKALYLIKDYLGVTGITSFDKNGDVIKQIQLMVIKNGRFIQFKE